MRQDINNSIHWIADEGKTFIRKVDNVDMGEEMWIGLNDEINNYMEEEYDN